MSSLNAAWKLFEEMAQRDIVLNILIVLFGLASIPKLLGAAGSQFKRDFGYPEWFGYIAGILELAGAALLCSSNEYHIRGGCYLLQAVIGGAFYSMLLQKLPPVPPVATGYGIMYFLNATGGLDYSLFWFASAAGVLAGVILRRLGRPAQIDKKSI
jgi:hypothetical protein